MRLYKLLHTTFILSVSLTSTLLPHSAASGDALLDRVLAGSHRPPADRARDEYRHPGETLEFFGIQPDMQVLEVLPGRGWYTQVLAPYLADQGKLIAASYGTDNSLGFLNNIHNGYQDMLEANPEVYGKVEVTILDLTNGSLEGVADGSVDMVLDFRNTHNFIRWGNITEAIYRSYYRVLKPGGVLGIIEHRARAGADPEESAPTGYTPEAYTIDLATRIGFKLAAQSEVNANPKDTKDHPQGVWTLPPSFRLGDLDRDRYAAIGESDRMTLKFVK